MREIKLSPIYPSHRVCVGCNPSVSIHDVIHSNTHPPSWYGLTLRLSPDLSTWLVIWGVNTTHPYTKILIVLALLKYPYTVRSGYICDRYWKAWNSCNWLIDIDIKLGKVLKTLWFRSHLFWKCPLYTILYIISIMNIIIKNISTRNLRSPLQKELNQNLN